MLKQSVELLMPAGDFEKAKFAFAFGADAVYLGIPRFSLRSRENGFKSFEQVAEAINYAHSLGKKAYVTANIFPHSHKLASFPKYVAELLALCKPDAWIISDPGLIMLMRENFPDEVIHISVQANTINSAAVKFWQNNGAKRIILSREITIKEMRDIHEACPTMELESFVHGAICMAYSGRCLISNYLSSRDGNQGACTNSCRWEYKVYKQEENYTPPEGQYFVKESERPDELFELDEDEHGSYLMNSKDLCAIDLLGELKDAGVCSFKVEGRCKTVYYLAMITRAYRRAIDDLDAGKPFDPKHLKDIFATSNRGFISGFLKGNPGQDGQEYKNSSSAYSTYRFTGLVRQYDSATKRLNVEPRNLLKVGQVHEICLPGRDITVEIKELFDDKMRGVREIHGGSKACWISFLPALEQDLGAFTLLREPIVEAPTDKGEYA